MASLFLYTFHHFEEFIIFQCRHKLNQDTLHQTKKKKNLFGVAQKKGLE